MKPIALITLLAFASLSSFCQYRFDWWYFGKKAGVHFTPSGPIAVTDGQLSTLEGAASISTAQGDLLFYTDGVTVWDSTHSVMPNGDSLYGHSSSSQSATILPMPGDPHKYYLFTTHHHSSSV